jgi:signal transduction histidine kinase
MIKSAAGRLTLYYLTIILALSIGFSLFLYHISDSQLTQGLKRPEFISTQDISFPDYDHFRLNRLQIAHNTLKADLIIFNLFILIAGGFVSYILAKHTLEPIEAALEAQSRYTADASHELRTPLTAMQAEIEVALRNSKLTVSEARNLLQSNLEEVSKLGSLSQNLLKLAGTERRLELKPIRLEEPVTQAIKSLAKTAKNKQIKIEPKVDGHSVMADKPALTEVITILLDNAIKYSSAKTTVTLASKHAGDQVSLLIQDQGRGIKAADLPHIFDRFYRQDASRTKNHVSGYGLGLSIAKRLIQLQAGQISVVSTPQNGTTFTVRLLRSDSKKS